MISLPSVSNITVRPEALGGAGGSVRGGADQQSAGQTFDQTLSDVSRGSPQDGATAPAAASGDTEAAKTQTSAVEPKSGQAKTSSSGAADPSDHAVAGQDGASKTAQKQKQGDTSQANDGQTNTSQANTAHGKANEKTGHAGDGSNKKKSGQGSALPSVTVTVGSAGQVSVKDVVKDQTGKSGAHAPGKPAASAAKNSSSKDAKHLSNTVVQEKSPPTKAEAAPATARPAKTTEQNAQQAQTHTAPPPSGQATAAPVDVKSALASKSKQHAASRQASPQQASTSTSGQAHSPADANAASVHQAGSPTHMANSPSNGTHLPTLKPADSGGSSVLGPVQTNSSSAIQPGVHGLENQVSQAATMHSAAHAEPGDASTSGLNAARLSRGLNSVVNQRGGSVTLRLTPPSMGTVRIQLHMQGTTVNAEFHAETEAAHGLLTQQIGHLRQALQNQGLAVDRLSVQHMQPTINGSATPQHSDQSQGDGRSRGFAGQQQPSNQGGGAGQDSGERNMGDRRRHFEQMLVNEVV